MTEYTYKKIVKQAKHCRRNVKKEYKLGMSTKWSYYICKALLTPNKSVTKITFSKAPNPKGTHISRQISHKSYLEMANYLVKFVEKNKRLPNYIEYGNYKIKPKLYTYLFSRILYYNYKKGKLPKQVNINSKAFQKPIETTNEVYNYFVDVFGKFDNTIDGALSKIAGNGYGYYYDDVYSNKISIDRMKQQKGVNCTDSCQVFYNIMLQLIALKKYKKVECLHVQCSGGDGHVRLRITMNDGTKIYRDPAAVLSNGNVTSNWCMNGTIIGINPSWFLENLSR